MALLLNRFILGQIIYLGYFEPAGCGTIGQAWFTAGVAAISLTPPLCLERVMLLFPSSLLRMMMMIIMMMMRVMLVWRMVGSEYVWLK